MAKKPAEPADYTPKPPQQVLDQIAAAEQLRAEMIPSQDSPSAEAAPSPAEAPPRPEGEAAAEAPSSAQPPQPAGEEQSWEQRHRSLQGRYETMQRNYQQQGERIGELERLINTFRAKGAEEPAAEPAAKVKPKFVTDQEATEYGEELLTVIGKRAKEEYFPEFDELAQRLKRLEGRVDGVGTVIEKTQVNDVYASLNNDIPEWKQINRSDEFKAWLDLPDPYSGRRRHDMLMEAFSGHETGRVVSFFRGFLTEATGLPPNSSSPGSSAPQPNGSGKPSLEDFAAPGRARSAPQNLPPDKPIYTAAWIAKFTADKIAGKYRGREEDADAIEQDIYRAQHEGRIQ